jgi:hypothetical protein
MRAFVTAAFVFAAAVVIAAPADADQCKDVPQPIGPFIATSQVCDHGNGTVTSCVLGSPPALGPPCQDFPASQMPPGFWDQP